MTDRLDTMFHLGDHPYPQTQQPMTPARHSRHFTAAAGILMVAAVLEGCTGSAPSSATATAEATAPALDLARLRSVDLSHAYNAQTIYWPNSPTTFSLQSQAKGPTPGGWFYSANSFASPEHGGTHLDAPIHFSEHGRSSEQMPMRANTRACRYSCVQASQRMRAKPCSSTPQARNLPATCATTGRDGL